MPSEIDPLDTIDMSMFGQMFSQLRSMPSLVFRHSYQPWQVQFKGEAGIDAGMFPPYLSFLTYLFLS